MKKIALIVLVTSLVACHSRDNVYTEYQELSPDVEWLKKDIREFKVPIENKSQHYNLSLSFRYATGYQFEIVKVKVTEVSPSGKEVEKYYDLKIKDAKGEYIGEAGYDIWDSEHLIEPNKNYEEIGSYTYKVEHIMPTDPLNYAMEIGVIVDKVK